jgi:hypothetical protein
MLGSFATHACDAARLGGRGSNERPANTYSFLADRSSVCGVLFMRESAPFATLHWSFQFGDPPRSISNAYHVLGPPSDSRMGGCPLLCLNYVLVPLCGPPPLTVYSSCRSSPE